MQEHLRNCNDAAGEALALGASGRDARQLQEVDDGQHKVDGVATPLPKGAQAAAKGAVPNFPATSTILGGLHGVSHVGVLERRADDEGSLEPRETSELLLAKDEEGGRVKLEFLGRRNHPEWFSESRDVM